MCTEDYGYSVDQPLLKYLTGQDIPNAITNLKYCTKKYNAPDSY
jgi:hypothetical protein